METKHIIFALAVLMATQSLYSQPQKETKDSKVPDSIKDLITTGVPEGEMRTAADAPQNFPPGAISKRELKMLGGINRKFAKLLAEASVKPDSAQSPWIPKLQAWKTKFDKVLSSGAQLDAFQMIPGMVDFFTRNKSSDVPELRPINDQMTDCGRYLIKACAAYVIQQNGVVGGDELNRFVQLFSVQGFSIESDWEEEEMPINAAGVMILDPDKVVEDLKAAPWQQTKRFLGGVKTPGDFFDRYISTGDGLAVLKSKYSQNKKAIDAKFNELATWVQQQEELEEKNKK